MICDQGREVFFFFFDGELSINTKQKKNLKKP